MKRPIAEWEGNALKIGRVDLGVVLRIGGSFRASCYLDGVEQAFPSMDQAQGWLEAQAARFGFDVKTSPW